MSTASLPRREAHVERIADIWGARAPIVHPTRHTAPERRWPLDVPTEPLLILELPGSCPVCRPAAQAST